MICCDVCENWFHYDCVGLDLESLDNIDSYVCQKCRRYVGDKETYANFEESKKSRQIKKKKSAKKIKTEHIDIKKEKQKKTIVTEILPSVPIQVFTLAEQQKHDLINEIFGILHDNVNEYYYPPQTMLEFASNIAAALERNCIDFADYSYNYSLIMEKFSV